jgi:3-phenylpropionate/trans-cinnamate dioxygenase ferredoxin subunit
MAFEKTIGIDELDDGVPRAVVLASGVQVCLVRERDVVYAMLDRCSHADFPISEGDVVDACTIECPLHGAQFDLRDGRVLEPPADEPLVMCDVRIDQRAVWVRPPA